MADTAGARPDASGEARPPAHKVVRALLRAAGSTIALVIIYYWPWTVFATVGFGDITAKTEAARLVVTGQMITDLVIIGLGVRVIVGAGAAWPAARPQGAGAQPSK